MPSPHHPAANSGSVSVTLNKKRMRPVQIAARTRPHHERTQQRPRLQIILAHRPRQRSVSGRVSCPCSPGIHLIPGPQPVQRCKNFVRNLRLHRNQIQRSHANRAARPHALRSHVEQLPVQIEPFIRTQKTPRQHKRNQQLLPDRQRIHLRNRQRHQRTRWPHNQRRNPRQPRRNRIGQRKPIKRCHLAGAQIGEGQNDQRRSVAPGPRPTRETAPPASTETPYSASPPLRPVVGRFAAASPGIIPVSICSAFMIVFSASRTSPADA